MPYHELSDLEGRLERVRNFHVTTRESGGKVVFLRKLAPGGTQHSFGIHVAQMAGLPNAVIKRAKQILQDLEQQAIDLGRRQQLETSTISVQEPADNYQLSIFESNDPKAAAVRQALEEVDPNQMTPMQALQLIQELKDKL